MNPSLVADNPTLSLLTEKEWNYITDDKSYLAVESLRDRGTNLFEALEIVDLAKAFLRNNK